MDWTITIKLFAALFAIMNPFTTMPVYLALTSNAPMSKRRSILFVMLATVVFGALATALLGRLLLDSFGIDVPHFALAGGLIVLLLALSMLSGENHSSHSGTDEEQENFPTDTNAGVYPLGIPLSMGPGTIATILIFGQSAKNSGHLFNYYIGLGGYLIFFSVVMVLALKIGPFLSANVLSVIKRIMGIILAAIAMEMICNALLKIFPVLHG